MKKSLFIFPSTVFLLISCNPLKKTSIETNSQSDPVQLAIEDFSQNCNIYKKTNVFYLSKREAVNNKNILIISITKNFTKLLLTTETKIGSKGKIESRFIEKNGKLFYWWDDDFPLTEEALKIFGKYNLLQDDMNGMLQFPDHFVDDKQKSAIYYFCKNNFGTYKNLITNDGKYHDQFPEIDCKCDSLKN